ncbi:hypothetical protein NHQ30_011337 [Ciborinia camelliae]|nr:hypothetical protein NHQ30_011337 [Ciborinia camelliae]
MSSEYYYPVEPNFGVESEAYANFRANIQYERLSCDLPLTAYPQRMHDSIEATRSFMAVLCENLNTSDSWASAGFVIIQPQPKSNNYQRRAKECSEFIRSLEKADDSLQVIAEQDQTWYNSLPSNNSKLQASLIEDFEAFCQALKVMRETAYRSNLPWLAVCFFPAYIQRNCVPLYYKLRKTVDKFSVVGNVEISTEEKDLWDIIMTKVKHLGQVMQEYDPDLQGFVPDAINPELQLEPDNSPNFEQNQYSNDFDLYDDEV